MTSGSIPKIFRRSLPRPDQFAIGASPKSAAKKTTVPNPTARDVSSGVSASRISTIVPSLSSLITGTCKKGFERVPVIAKFLTFCKSFVKAFTDRNSCVWGAATPGASPDNTPFSVNSGAEFLPARTTTFPPLSVHSSTALISLDSSVIPSYKAKSEVVKNKRSTHS